MHEITGSKWGRWYPFDEYFKVFEKNAKVTRACLPEVGEIVPPWTMTRDMVFITGSHAASGSSRCNPSREILRTQ
ncbi:MAG: hypothetical protein ACK46C_00455 [Flavobacteriales bacterium]